MTVVLDKNSNYIKELKEIKLIFGEDISKSNDLDSKTDLLLRKHSHYLNTDLFDGYDSDNENINFRIGYLSIFKSTYRSISDETIIRKLIKWIKYLPYENHNKILVKLICDSFSRYADHLRKTLDSNYVYSKIYDPLKRMLWFLFEECLNEVVEKTFFDVNRFNSIMYDVLNFVTNNKKLFLI